jgi:hypothetical protein
MCHEPQAGSGCAEADAVVPLEALTRLLIIVMVIEVTLLYESRASPGGELRVPAGIGMRLEGSVWTATTPCDSAVLWHADGRWCCYGSL